MIGITKKRLYKIKKIKNQSRKIPKRKHKRKRKKKQNKSFRRRRKYNLKNKSLKKYKGGGFFTLDDINKTVFKNQDEMTKTHKKNIKTLKKSTNGGPTYIKQIERASQTNNFLFRVTESYFDDKGKLQVRQFKKSSSEEIRPLSNQLLDLNITIDREREGKKITQTKPLFQIINSIFLKQALNPANAQAKILEKLDQPIYQTNEFDASAYPYHDDGNTNGSKNLLKDIQKLKWFKDFFQSYNEAEKYGVKSLKQTGIPDIIEPSQVYSHQTTSQPVSMTGEPVINISDPTPSEPSKKVEEPPVKVEEPSVKVQDLPRKESDSDTETENGSETETDDETIIQDLKLSAPEIAELEARLSQEDKFFENYHKGMSFDDYGKQEFFDDWFKQDNEQDDATLLSSSQIKNEYEGIDNEEFDNLFQTIQADDDEVFVTRDDDNIIQKRAGFKVMTDKEREELYDKVVEEIESIIKKTDKVIKKIPDNSQPLENPVIEAEEIDVLLQPSRTSSSSSLGVEENKDGEITENKDGEITENKDGEAVRKQNVGQPKPTLGQKIKGKLKKFANAGDDPETGFAAKIGKLAPKKYVKLPPSDKPNVYFKATFQNDDWNLKLEKEGFAKDARSWLSKVGIMSGGNITEIKSY